MLKIGVVGAGHLGKIHLQNLLLLENNFQVSGFFDTDSQIQKEVSSNGKLKAFFTYEELLDHVDAVLLACPTVSHFPMAIQALKRRKHLFIEKPVCLNSEESKLLLSYASEAGVVIQVGHVERFNPAFVAAKEFIDTPMFIESHRLAPFQERGSDISVVLDLMIHDIDIALKMANSRVKRISASGMEVMSSETDIASVRLEFENGCVANLTASRIAQNRVRKSRFFMKDHCVIVDFLNKEVERTFVEQEKIQDKVQKILKSERIMVEEINAIYTELRSFAQSITLNEKVIVGMEDAHHAMQIADYIIERIQESRQFVK